MSTPSMAARLRAFLRLEGEVLGAFACSRLLIWALAWMAYHGFRHGKYGPDVRGDELWNLLFHWDAAWYRGIAEVGYYYVPGQQSSVAFFPLYPLCLRAFCALTGAGAPLVGFILSNLFLLGSVILLRRLAAIDFPAPSRVPERAVWLLLLYPVTFFHSAVYTESLFLFLSLGAILAARKRQWALAGLAGAFLSGTRANGIFIIVPLVWEAVIEPWRRPDFHLPTVIRSCAWLLLVPVGLTTYCIYLHFTFGDALAFVHATAVWGRTFTTPWRATADAWVMYPGVYRRLFVATETIAIGTLVAGFWIRIRMSYLLYAAAMLLMLLSNTLFEALPRYVSIIFPLQIALAAATVRSEALYLTALAASAALMTLCLGLYVGGYWFT